MANMNFGVNLLPKATNTYTLGNSDYKWLVNGMALNEASSKGVDTSITSSSSVNLPTTSAVVAYITGLFNNPVFTGSLSKGRLAGSTVGSGSVALGADVTASGTSSFAVGNKTIANHYAQMVLGEFNVADPSTAQATARGNYILIVGNGTTSSTLSDALTLDWNGNLRIKGSMYVGANADGTGGTAVLTSAPVTDVQINGSSILTSGVANIPCATESVTGVVRGNSSYGIAIGLNGLLSINCADASQVKAGTTAVMPLVPYFQHSAVFYGLSKVAGVDLANETVTLGTYPSTSQSAICTMIGAIKEPSSEGTNGQVLTTNGNGGRTWTTVSGGSNTLIVGFQSGTETLNKTWQEIHDAFASGTIVALQYGDITQYLVTDVSSYNGTYSVFTQIMPDGNSYGFIASSANGYPEYVSSSNDLPVTDVQVNSTSVITSGVANIPIASTSALGVVGMSGDNYGIAITSSGNLYINSANATAIKTGTSGYLPITPINEHVAVFYGLAKASGDSTQASSSNAVGTYTSDAQASIRTMLGAGTYSKPSGGIPSTDLASGVIPDISGKIDEPATEGTNGQVLTTDGNGGRSWTTVQSGGGTITDVQINSTSVVSNNVANIPIAGSNLGVVKIDTSYGIGVTSAGYIGIVNSGEATIKAGNGTALAVTLARQHMSVFYGLAKVAGVDLASETVTLGTYPANAQSAICTMIGAYMKPSTGIPSTDLASGVIPDVSGKADKSDTVLDTTLSRGRATNSTVGYASIAFGNNITSSGICSCAIGNGLISSGGSSFATGESNVVNGDKSFVGGYGNRIKGNLSFGFGTGLCTYGNNLFSFGKYNYRDTNDSDWVSGQSYAVGDYAYYSSVLYCCTEANSDAEFDSSKWSVASKDSDFLEVVGCGSNDSTRITVRTLDANGNLRVKGKVYINANDKGRGGGELATTNNPTFYNSISMGRLANSTVGASSIALGYDVTSSAYTSLATGMQTTASGNFSFSGGYGTIANHESQFVFGEYNISDSNISTANTRGDYIEIVGNGTSSTRSNARTLDWNGNMELAGNLTLNAYGQNAVSLADRVVPFTGASTSTNGTYGIVPAPSAYQFVIPPVLCADGTWQDVKGVRHVTTLTKGTNPSESTYYCASYGYDDQGVDTKNRLCAMRGYTSTSGTSIVQLIAYRFTANSTQTVQFNVGIRSDGTTYYALTDPSAFRTAISAVGVGCTWGDLKGS